MLTNRLSFSLILVCFFYFVSLKRSTCILNSLFLKIQSSETNEHTVQQHENTTNNQLPQVVVKVAGELFGFIDFLEVTLSCNCKQLGD